MVMADFNVANHKVRWEIGRFVRLPSLRRLCFLLSLPFPHFSPVCVSALFGGGKDAFLISGTSARTVFAFQEDINEEQRSVLKILGYAKKKKKK